jgi:hypothetical protein
MQNSIATDEPYEEGITYQRNTIPYIEYVCMLYVLEEDMGACSMEQVANGLWIASSSFIL